MANVLGELFSEIAESIRGGLGDIDKMKPSTFPDKIDEIVELLKNSGSGDGGAGGSEGSGSVGNLKFAYGFIKADAERNRATVTHGLDTMPDFILVHYAGMYLGEVAEYVEEKPLTFAWGLKSTFDLEDVQSYCAIASPGICFPIDTYGIDNAPESSRSTGCIFCPDETTFEVGAQKDQNAYKLSNKSGMQYRWLAISGLGSAAPILESLNVIENGTYTPPDGVDGFSSVTVAVPSGDAGGNEEPLIKYCSNSTETTGNPTSSHQIKFTLSKETKVLGAWAGGNQDKSVYPTTVSLFPVPVSNLTVDESNANYNTWYVPYEFYNPFLSGTYKKSIHVRLLVTVPGITVASRGDGYYDGKLNYVDTYEYPIKRSDFGTYTSLLFKKFTFAEGVSEAPQYLCYGQTYLDDVDLSNITSIGACAFDSCTSLKSIKLSPDLNSIDSNAFYKCTSLTGELVIPQKITSLPNYCFQETKFDRVVFHNNMVFDTYAVRPFYYCTHPTEYDFSAFTHVPALYASNYFGYTGKGQVFKIPAALFDIWSTSDKWSDWASQMVAV